MSFDPYYQWLGIPPKDQPADCYQLLGIRRFEQNATVISNAAERQLLMLKTMQNGPHGALTQKLMNEVTAARIRLLDARKKSAYDAELRHGTDAGNATPPPLSSSQEAVARTEPPAVEDPHPAKMIQTNGNRKKRRSDGRGRNRVGRRIVAGIVIAIGLAMVIFWVSRYRSQGGTPAHSRTSQAERNGKLDARAAVGPQPGPRRSETPESGSGQTDSESPATDSDVAQAGAGELPSAVVAQPVGPESGNAGDLPTGDSPAELSQDEILKGAASEPSKVVADASGDTGHVDESERTSEAESTAFSRLPNELDLLEAVAASDASHVFIGDLASPAKSTWAIAIEDYAAPPGRSRFSVGAAISKDNLVNWPLFRSVIDGSPPGENVAVEDVASAEMFARVEASPTELSLWLSDPKNQELISQLSMCGLILENGQSRHHVQLSMPHRIPPVSLEFGKAKQAVTFDNVSNINKAHSERVLLEIMPVDQSTGGSPAGSVLRGRVDEEVTITLNSTLQCELGIKLKKSAEQYGITILPRFTHNDRRRPLVPATITKGIARARLQLARNQRDLSEARNRLRLLPQEISRVRGMVPRTPSDVAAQQARLSQLVGMVDSMRARVRRLSKVIPELTAGVERMERVLAYANQLASQATLHFRVYAQGEMGEFLLLIETSDSN